VLNRLAHVRTLFRNEDGATLTEYALTLLLMIVVTLAAITVIGSKLSTFFQAAATSV